MVTRKKTKTSYKKWTVICLVLVAAVVAGFVIYNSRHNKPVADTPNGVNLSPATPEEKAESNQLKEESNQPSPSETPTNPDTNTSNDKRSVKPVITGANQYDGAMHIGAFIPSLYESGGMCAFTLTQGDTTITKQTDGVQDATTTRCTNLVIPRSEFPTPGDWSVVVTYTSSTATGVSTAMTAKVE